MTDETTELTGQILHLRELVLLGLKALREEDRRVAQNAAHEFEQRAVKYFMGLDQWHEDRATERQKETGRCSMCGALLLECRCE